MASPKHSTAVNPVFSVAVPKIHCVRQTLQGKKDDIFGSFFLVPITATGPLKPHGVVIPLKQKVCTGDIWTGLPNPVPLSLAPETIGVIVTMVLYNNSNDVIYDRLLRDACHAGMGRAYPWESILRGTGEIAPRQSRIQQQYTAMKVSIETLKYFTMDDYLGSHTYSLFLPESAEDKYPREFVFSERGSKYMATVKGFFG